MSQIARALRPLQSALRSSLSHPSSPHAPIAVGIHSSSPARNAGPTAPVAKGAKPAQQASDATVGRDDVVDTIFGTKLSRRDFPPAVLNALDVQNATRRQQRNARKRGIIERFKRSPSDTGSPEVQIALLTDQIKDLTTHMLANKKDTPRKRTMSMLVNQRRRLMAYLLRESPQRYSTLVAELGLRPNAVFSKDVPLGAKKAPGPLLR